MLIERLSPRGLRKPAASRAWLQTSHSSGKAGAMSPTRDLWLGQRRATRCVPSPYQAVPGGGPAPGMLPARRTRYPCLPRPAQANLAQAGRPGHALPSAWSAAGPCGPAHPLPAPAAQSGRSARQLGAPALRGLRGASPCAAEEAPGRMAGSQEGPLVGPSPQSTRRGCRQADTARGGPVAQPSTRFLSVSPRRGLPTGHWR